MRVTPLLALSLVACVDPPPRERPSTPRRPPGSSRRAGCSTP
ncbi:MAG: hypothetical protein R3F60_26465 [bacterium]